MHVKLTADSITDDQIRALRQSKEWPTLWLREFALALGEVRAVNDPDGDRQAARARCAEIYNAGSLGKQLLTAATITDAQIRDLIESGDLSAGERADCTHALQKRDRHWTRFQRSMQHGARARCAQAFNARAARST